MILFCGVSNVGRSMWGSCCRIEADTSLWLSSFYASCDVCSMNSERMEKGKHVCYNLRATTREWKEIELKADKMEF